MTVVLLTRNSVWAPFQSAFCLKWAWCVQSSTFFFLLLIYPFIYFEQWKKGVFSVCSQALLEEDQKKSMQDVKACMYQGVQTHQEALLCCAGAGALAQGPESCWMSSLEIPKSQWDVVLGSSAGWPCWGRVGPKRSRVPPTSTNLGVCDLRYL